MVAQSLGPLSLVLGDKGLLRCAEEDKTSVAHFVHRPRLPLGFPPILKYAHTGKSDQTMVS